MKKKSNGLLAKVIVIFLIIALVVTYSISFVGYLF